MSRDSRYTAERAVLEELTQARQELALAKSWLRFAVRLYDVHLDNFRTQTLIRRNFWELDNQADLYLYEQGWSQPEDWLGCQLILLHLNATLLHKRAQHFNQPGSSTDQVDRNVVALDQAIVQRRQLADEQFAAVCRLASRAESRNEEPDEYRLFLLHAFASLAERYWALWTGASLSIRLGIEHRKTQALRWWSITFTSIGYFTAARIGFIKKGWEAYWARRKPTPIGGRAITKDEAFVKYARQSGHFPKNS